jgi:AcrR family transcriptional regulator
MDRRLVDAVTEVSARDGFAALTVERVLAVSGGSRASFYQYFPSVEECFFSAFHGHATQLVNEVKTAVRGSSEPELDALDAVVSLAESQPYAARVLALEGLGSGPHGLTERDALIGSIRDAIGVSRRDPRIDVPTGALIGATLRFLAMRLAAGDVERSCADAVREWAGVFAWPGSRTPWQRAGDRTTTTPRRRPVAKTPRISGRVAPRERVLRGIAAVVRANGYRRATVAEIAAAAGVSRRFVYHHFEDKAAAFVAAYEYGFEAVLSAAAVAFFSAGTLEERIWRAGLAYARWCSREPVLCHLGFAQCYSLGPSFAHRVHETQLAFTWLLDERHHPPSTGRVEPGARAILTAALVAELGMQATLRGSAVHLRASLPTAVYAVLAPITGPERATRFISGKLKAQSAVRHSGFTDA